MVAALLLGSLWACSDSLVEIGGELSLALDGPSTAPLSDSVEISYEARGRSLLGLVLDYGDGAADSVFFVGSQSAGGRISHKYDQPGAYRITGKVQDGLEGSTVAELSVTVVP